MKKQYLLLPAALLLAGAAHAQGTDLFMSEYDEGAHQSGVSYNGGVSNSTGSERAVEFFNPTNGAVPLGKYSFRRYSNGSATVTEEERLLRSDASQNPVGTNVLNSRACFVLASGEATLTDIRNAASQFSVGHAPVSGPTVLTGGGAVYFNGDDAVALVRWTGATAGQGTPILIDIFGSIGYQPTSAGGGTGNWSGTNAIDGTPAVYVVSANQSLVRRSNISRGITTNPPTTWNPADEWRMYSTAFNGPGGTSNPAGQSYSNLGTHTYTGPVNAYLSNKQIEEFNAGISVYPNPAHGTATVELKDVKVGSLTVMNNLGQTIMAQPKGLAQEKLTLDISGLRPGLYFVKCLSADGLIKIYKELVVQ